MNLMDIENGGKCGLFKPFWLLGVGASVSLGYLVRRVGSLFRLVIANILCERGLRYKEVHLRASYVTGMRMFVCPQSLSATVHLG